MFMPNSCSSLLTLENALENREFTILKLLFYWYFGVRGLNPKLPRMILALQNCLNCIYITSSRPGFELMTSRTGDVRSNQLRQSDMPGKETYWRCIILNSKTRYLKCTLIDLFFSSPSVQRPDNSNYETRWGVT